MTAGFSVRGVKKLGRRSDPGKSNSRAGESQGTDLAYRDKPRAPLLGTANKRSLITLAEKRLSFPIFRRLLSAQ